MAPTTPTKPITRPGAPARPAAPAAQPVQNRDAKARAAAGEPGAARALGQERSPVTGPRSRNDPAPRAAQPVARMKENQNPDARAEHAAKPRRRGTIRVRALKMVYYDDQRRRIGDVFDIRDESEFSEKSMEYVDDRTPTRTTTGKEALKQHHDDTLGARMNPGARQPAETAHDNVDNEDDDGPEANPLDAE